MMIKKALSVCTLSVACMSAAIAGPTNVPFKGTMNFVGTLDFTGNPACLFEGMNYGSGMLTQIGRAVLVATDCVTPVGQVLSATDGKLTLTAPSGDTLTGTYAGTFIPVNNGAAYQFSGVMFSITGGTGRFLNARGTGTLHGIQEVVGGKGSITVDGRISY